MRFFQPSLSKWAAAASVALICSAIAYGQARSQPQPQAQAQAPTQPQPKTQPSKQPKPQPALPKPSAPTAQDLLKTADEIAARVSQQRGLRIKHPLKKGVLSRNQIVSRLMDRVKREYSAVEIKAEEAVLKRLGLLEPDTDYEKTITDLLTEQVAGFYDPFAKELFIADWLDVSLQRPALAHEIGHALCDQHFDLKPYATPIKDNGDRQLARAALVEGDGTAVMLEFTMAEQAAAMGVPMAADIGQIPDALFSMTAGLMSGTMPAFDRAPRYLRETLVFPYIEGLRFVVHVRRRKPWSAIDEIYRHPPESTEQILHPEKYFARERPVVVTDTALPAGKAGGWKVIRKEVLGEYQTRLWLETRLDAMQAKQASQGWGGDRLVAYEPTPGGPLVLVALSTWDSEADANEFARAVSRLFARRVARPELSGSVVAYTQGAETFAVEQRADRVLVLIGAPAAIRNELSAAAWLWKSGPTGKSRPPPAK